MDYDRTSVPDSYDAGREISDDKKRAFVAEFAQITGTAEILKIIDLRLRHGPLFRHLGRCV